MSGQITTMNSLLTSLRGYRTYLTVAAVLVLLIGTWLGWWTIPASVYAALGAAAIGFLRAGLGNEVADAAQAIITARAPGTPPSITYQPTRAQLPSSPSPADKGAPPATSQPGMWTPPPAPALSPLTPGRSLSPQSAFVLAPWRRARRAGRVGAHAPLGREGIKCVALILVCALLSAVCFLLLLTGCSTTTAASSPATAATALAPTNGAPTSAGHTVRVCWTNNFIGVDTITYENILTPAGTNARTPISETRIGITLPLNFGAIVQGFTAGLVPPAVQ